MGVRYHRHSHVFSQDPRGEDQYGAVIRAVALRGACATACVESTLVNINRVDTPRPEEALSDE